MATRNFYVSRVSGEHAKRNVPFVGDVLSYEHVVELIANVKEDIEDDYDSRYEETNGVGVGSYFTNNVGGVMFDVNGSEVDFIGLVVVADDMLSDEGFDNDIWSEIKRRSGEYEEEDFEDEEDFENEEF